METKLTTFCTVCVLATLSILCLPQIVTAAGVWQAIEGAHLPQNSPLYAEVIPAESDASNRVDWWGGQGSVDGGVRFAPSQSFIAPQPGDDRCWLYDHPTERIWWQGKFALTSSTIYIQLVGCDTNDGLMDVYVDGNKVFTYDCEHQETTDVRIIGSLLENKAHTVTIKTYKEDPYLNNGDVPIDYIALRATTFGSLDSDVTYLPEQGGSVNFELFTGEENGGRMYFLLGSISGTSPGLTLPGGMVMLPINWDVFTDIVVSLPNSPYFKNFLGTFDPNGYAYPQLNMGALPGMAGLTMYFAYCVNNPFDLASNSVSINIVP